MDDELIKIVKIIGSVVLTAFLYAFPILLTCSFAFSWAPVIKWVLTVINICSFTTLCSAIYDEVDE